MKYTYAKVLTTSEKLMLLDKMVKSVKNHFSSCTACFHSLNEMLDKNSDRDKWIKSKMKRFHYTTATAHFFPEYKKELLSTAKQLGCRTEYTKSGDSRFYVESFVEPFMESFLRYESAYKEAENVRLKMLEIVRAKLTKGDNK